VITCRATLDVPRVVRFVARLLAAERRRRGTPRGSRALTCFWRAVLGVRRFRDRATDRQDAGDAPMSAMPLLAATTCAVHCLISLYISDQSPDLARDELATALKNLDPES